MSGHSGEPQMRILCDRCRSPGERAYSGFVAELARLRQLDATIYNLLGLRDPDDVAKWIAGARRELAESRARDGLEP